VETTGDDLNYADAAGRTAIFLAAIKNLGDVIFALASRGADVNKANVDGETPLLVAAREGCLDAVSILLQFDAAAHLMSAAGRFPLQEALDCGHYYCAESTPFGTWARAHGSCLATGVHPIL
jgi:ankyrin repeat protein